jgi:hypothetical protein
MPKKKKKTKRQEILEVLVHEKRHLRHRSESFLPLSLPPGFFFILSLSLSLSLSSLINDHPRRFFLIYAIQR